MRLPAACSQPERVSIGYHRGVGYRISMASPAPPATNDFQDFERECFGDDECALDDSWYYGCDPNEECVVLSPEEQAALEERASVLLEEGRKAISQRVDCCEMDAARERARALMEQKTSS